MLNPTMAAFPTVSSIRQSVLRTSAKLSKLLVVRGKLLLCQLFLMNRIIYLAYSLDVIVMLYLQSLNHQVLLVRVHRVQTLRLPNLQM